MVNLVDGLERIREMLVNNNANPATLDAVDAILDNANLMSGGNAQAQSLLQVTKMLMRTPAANQNVSIYNDLTKIEQHLTIRANVMAQQRETTTDRPMPKDKKFYKAQKEREKKAKA